MISHLCSQAPSQDLCTTWCWLPHRTNIVFCLCWLPHRTNPGFLLDGWQSLVCFTRANSIFRQLWFHQPPPSGAFFNMVRAWSKMHLLLCVFVLNAKTALFFLTHFCQWWNHFLLVLLVSPPPSPPLKCHNDGASHNVISFTWWHSFFPLNHPAHWQHSPLTFTSHSTGRKIPASTKLPGTPQEVHRSWFLHSKR